MSQHNIGISLFEVQPSALDIFSKTEPHEVCDFPPEKTIKAIAFRKKFHTAFSETPTSSNGL